MRSITSKHYHAGYSDSWGAGGTLRTGEERVNILEIANGSEVLVNWHNHVGYSDTWDAGGTR